MHGEEQNMSSSFRLLASSRFSFTWRRRFSEASCSLKSWSAMFIAARVNLALNPLLTDRELPGAAEAAAHASDIGVDAVIVQDLGVARMLRPVAEEKGVELLIVSITGAVSPGGGPPGR